MITNEIKEIAAKLGKFFLQEKNGDYNAACEEITKVRINQLSLDGEKLVIETSRPGLLIGKRGKRIEGIQNHMGMPLHIVETTQHITDYIYPYEEDIDDELFYNAVSDMIEESYANTLADEVDRQEVLNHFNDYGE